ncbi:MAG: hypothetical protein ACRDZO_29275 [Egibacteraceae bacterium]
MTRHRHASISPRIQFRRIAALRPDASTASRPKSAAPAAGPDDILAQPSEHEDYTTAWQEGVKARFAQAREQHPEFAGATVVAAYDFGDGTIGLYGPRDPRTRIVGRVFGRAKRAEVLVAEVEARLARERAEHPEFEGKTALGDLDPRSHCA